MTRTLTHERSSAARIAERLDPTPEFDSLEAPAPLDLVVDALVSKHGYTWEDAVTLLDEYISAGKLALSPEGDVSFSGRRVLDS
jgi:hypothetical protein